MHRCTRRFALTALVSASLFLAAGCSGTTSPGSRLRIVHASPDAPAVDVLVDNREVLADVTYPNASGYLAVTPGTRNVRVNVANTSTSAIDADVTLDALTDTTILATGRVSSIAPLVLTDNNAAPAAGNIKLRLVHAASGAANVDIYVTAPGADLAAASPTLANVAFRTASGYLEVPAGTYRVRITPTGTKDIAIDSGSVTLTAGQIRTAVAIGDPGAGRPLAAIVLSDN